jgi:tetraacyldisaccharide 4'-kinase
MPDASAVGRIWWGRGALPALARTALSPLELLYRGIVAARGALFDRGVLSSHPLALPALSVGNLTVGGTGKTPVAAYLAARLRERGARPAIVLRGYGDDEPLVHATLNEDVPVIVSANRMEGARQARAQGASIVVLDDAFQHRRARRDADVVLVSADRWTSRQRLLPAGPWREPLSALRRATAAIVTRKAATPERADEVRRALETAVPGLPVATVHLAPDMLRSANGPERQPLEALAGRVVTAIAAIGDPDAFVAQLRATGADVRPALFADHHAFTQAETMGLALRAAEGHLAVCTLKDAVKLAPGWPRAAPPLWYVSQRVHVERGEDVLEALLARMLRSQSSPRTDSAGAAGATPTSHGH